MTYEEIEALLKGGACHSTIERLRVAVGEEAEDLAKGNTGFCQDPQYCAERAREYYAESITQWLDSGDSPDPETLLGMRARYVNSWAFAAILRRLNHDDDDREIEVTDQAIMNICEANGQLGIKLVEMMERIDLMRPGIEALAALKRIREALDAVGGVTLNDLGNRKLEVWERVEVLLAEVQELRGHVCRCEEQT